MQHKYKEIQEQFNKVIAHSQNIFEPKTDKLFEDWLKAKQTFIHCFNGELIYEWPQEVSFELSKSEKDKRVSDFISEVNYNWNNWELSDFINYEREGFFNNRVIKEYNTEQGYKIPVGMKLVKAFKYFEPNEKALHYLQSQASMIIQEDKIKGRLCFSVHPLDFLSLSENTHNWRSCHSLDGDYKSGNLSYMVDRATVICYLKSNKEEKLPNFPKDVQWNSKKWRTLLFFSDDFKIMFAGRSYPFSTETGLDFIREEALPKAGLGNWSNWCKKKIKSVEDNGVHFKMYSPYIPIGNKLIPLKDIIIEEPNSLMFNDLLYSSHYDPLYAYRTEQVSFFNFASGDVDTRYDIVDLTINPEKTKVYIGGTVNCCRCGEPHIEINESFMCNNCELEYGDAESDMFAYCDCCGRRYFYDEGLWIEGSHETVCPDCYDQFVVTCGHCGDDYYRTDCIYDQENEEYLCKYCAEELEVINIEEEE